MTTTKFRVPAATPVEVARAIRQMRESKGLSQRALAAIVPCPSRTIERLERGNKFPTLDTLLRICEALDFEPEINFREKKGRYK